MPIDYKNIIPPDSDLPKDHDKINEENEEQISSFKITTKVILIVDDIVYIVKSIAKILRNAGYYVITAQTGAEALMKFGSYQPDLITIDQKLPDMTGYQLVEKINKMNVEKKPKIIFISAVYEREEIKSILQLGIENYLLKPVSKSKLIETVNSVLK
jgi:CheY-like chemotaxis protein